VIPPSAVEEKARQLAEFFNGELITHVDGPDRTDDNVAGSFAADSGTATAASAGPPGEGLGTALIDAA
jgi:hypothetical protein